MALSFNGTSSQLFINNKLISVAFPTTLFCWTKPTNLSIAGFPLMIGQSSGTSEELGIYNAANGSGKMQSWASQNGNIGSIQSSASVVTTPWEPCMCVFTNANSATIYYANGSAVTADPGGFTPFVSLMNKTTVGSRPNNSFWFSGDIAEIAIWNIALSGSDWTALLAGAAPETVSNSSLIDSWSLLTQASTQTGTKGNVFTSVNTSQAATHPIVRNVAPVLSSPTVTSITSSTATGSVTTDGSDGTMYSIVSTSATPPSVAQIQAGQNSSGVAAVWSGNQAISSSGTKNFSITGLASSTTYYAYFQHKNAAAADSLVVSSSSFTTSAVVAAAAIITNFMF